MQCHDVTVGVLCRVVFYCCLSPHTIGWDGNCSKGISIHNHYCLEHCPAFSLSSLPTLSVILLYAFFECKIDSIRFPPLSWLPLLQAAVERKAAFKLSAFFQACHYGWPVVFCTSEFCSFSMSCKSPYKSQKFEHFDFHLLFAYVGESGHSILNINYFTSTNAYANRGKKSWEFQHI